LAGSKIFGVLIMLFMLMALVLAGSLVYAQEGEQKENAERQACFSLLQKEVRKEFGVDFPFTYGEFAEQASVHSSRQNMISRIASAAKFKYHTVTFGAPTVWTPDSPYFADKWPETNEYAVIFYYDNTTFDGCGFTRISPLGNYTYDTMYYRFLSPDGGTSRISNVSELNMVQDGFKFNVARYVRDFMDYGGNEFVRYSRISLASNLTTAKEEQVWAMKVLLYSEVAELREENMALRGKVESLSAAKQADLQKLLVYGGALLMVAAVVVLVVLLARKGEKKPSK